MKSPRARWMSSLRAPTQLFMSRKTKGAIWCASPKRSSRPLPKYAALRGSERSPAWCPGEDSNLHELLHWYLKPARLPVPPPGQDGSADEALESTHPTRPCQLRGFPGPGPGSGPDGHPLGSESSLTLELLAAEPLVLLDLEPSRDYFLGLFSE